ncbi:MAG TPA: hypothetical protein VFC67_09285 [Prolixibacteraceae bacterium]|nr:hypothetical protein [Prolixibacteraceae bacterium]
MKFKKLKTSETSKKIAAIQAKRGKGILHQEGKIYNECKLCPLPACIDCALVD